MAERNHGSGPSSYTVRLLTSSDLLAVERLVRTSEYVYQRFMPKELPLLLKHYPAVGAFERNTLHGFLLSQSVNPPIAWISGFGVSWTESSAYIRILQILLTHLSPHLTAQGVQYLHYSANDGDWLRTLLLSWEFIPYRLLYAYDKVGYGIPTQGNQHVTIRPVKLSNILSDLPALLTIEQACFEDLWRYDAAAFADIAATYPYFVVAELDGKVVGYQFNALENDMGYLIRIAVHPSFAGQGIGARLMAEAMHFFERARVSSILLNTEENNTHAHRLYEWFGFTRLQQTGFVLRKYL